MLKTVSYVLPSFWASALINGDWSGLDEAAAETLRAYLQAFPDRDSPVSCDDAGFRRVHDASDFVSACDCQEFVYLADEEA